MTVRSVLRVLSAVLGRCESSCIARQHSTILCNAGGLQTQLNSWRPRRGMPNDRASQVDLYALSTRLLSSMAQQDADTLNLAGHLDAKAESGVGKPDRTHLNEKRTALFGRMVADNLIQTEVELGPNIIGVPSAQGVAVPKQAAPTDGR